MAKKIIEITTSTKATPGQMIDKGRFEAMEHKAYQASNQSEQNGVIIIALIFGSFVVAGIALAALLF